MAILARQAAPRLELELPMMEAASEHAVFDLAEPRQVGLPVRAPALDAPTVELEELADAPALLAEALLDIRDPLGRQRLEECHDVFVEVGGIRPMRHEAARKK